MLSKYDYMLIRLIINRNGHLRPPGVIHSAPIRGMSDGMIRNILIGYTMDKLINCFCNTESIDYKYNLTSKPDLMFIILFHRH